MRRLVPIAAIALSVLGGGCDDNGSSPTKPVGERARLDLTIGALVPLSGDFKAFGEPGIKAAGMALDQIRGAIRKSGADHEVSLVAGDEVGDPEAAVDAAERLVDQDASCIAGAWPSVDTVAVADEVTIPEGVAQISPASTRGDIGDLDDDDLLSRTAPPDPLQAEALVRLMERELGDLKGMSVAVGARDDAYGTSLADAIVPALERRKARVAGPVLWDVERRRFAPQARELVAHSPDAWVFADRPDPFDRVAEALERTGSWSPHRTFVTDGLVDTALPATVSEASVNGLRGTAPATPRRGEQARAFDTLFRAARPRDVKRQTFDAQAFDAVVLCYLGAVAAASTDGQDIAAQLRALSGPPGKRYSFEQLPQLIEALEAGDDVDYVGASGEIDLDAEGDPMSALYSANRFAGVALFPLGGPILVEKGR